MRAVGTHRRLVTAAMLVAGAVAACGGASTHGSTQVTYDGLPLYLYSGDSGPGSTNGNYTGWSLVRP